MVFILNRLYLIIIKKNVKYFETYDVKNVDKPLEQQVAKTDNSLN